MILNSLPIEYKNMILLRGWSFLIPGGGGWMEKGGAMKKFGILGGAMKKFGILGGATKILENLGGLRKFLDNLMKWLDYRLDKYNLCMHIKFFRGGHENFWEIRGGYEILRNFGGALKIFEILGGAP